MDIINEQRISGEFITLHEGIPIWFPRLVSYILNTLQGKDRFNIYNASRVLNSTGQIPFIFASDIRSVLERFDGNGLTFSGNHKQKVFLRKPLLHFWSSFFLHVQDPCDYDLGFFGLMLHHRRFNQIVDDSFFKQILPGNRRSLSKDRLVTILLREIFSSTENYYKYEQDRLCRLSKSANTIYQELSDKRKSYSELDEQLGGVSPQLVYDLCYALIATPVYIAVNGSLHLHISKFRGFKAPYQFNKLLQVSTIPIYQCLSAALLHAKSIANDPQISDNLYQLQFPTRQIFLFRSECSFATPVLEFIKMWREVFGTKAVKKASLPPDNFILIRNYHGQFTVFALDEYKPEQYLKVATEYGFLHQDNTGHIALTELGLYAGGSPLSDMKVKVVWGRNVDRVSVTLGGYWPNEFKALLNQVGSLLDNDRYDISKKTVQAKNISEKTLLTILGGFIKLDSKRLSRLRNWFHNESVPKIIQAAAIPISEHFNIENLLQKSNSGKYIYHHVAGFIIVIGLSRSQLIKAVSN